jgi:hypothetical protein
VEYKHNAGSAVALVGGVESLTSPYTATAMGAANDLVWFVCQDDKHLISGKVVDICSLIAVLCIRSW